MRVVCVRVEREERCERRKVRTSAPEVEDNLLHSLVQLGRGQPAHRPAGRCGRRGRGGRGGGGGVGHGGGSSRRLVRRRRAARLRRVRRGRSVGRCGRGVGRGGRSSRVGGRGGRRRGGGGGLGSDRGRRRVRHGRGSSSLGLCVGHHSVRHGVSVYVVEGVDFFKFLGPEPQGHSYFLLCSSSLILVQRSGRGTGAARCCAALGRPTRAQHVVAAGAPGQQAPPDAPADSPRPTTRRRALPLLLPPVCPTARGGSGEWPAGRSRGAAAAAARGRPGPGRRQQHPRDVRGVGRVLQRLGQRH